MTRGCQLVWLGFWPRLIDFGSARVVIFISHHPLLQIKILILFWGGDDAIGIVIRTRSQNQLAWVKTRAKPIGNPGSKPEPKGGLSIRDPGLKTQNLAFSSKMWCVRFLILAPSRGLGVLHDSKIKPYFGLIRTQPDPKRSQNMLLWLSDAAPKIY